MDLRYGKETHRCQSKVRAFDTVRDAVCAAVSGHLAAITADFAFLTSIARLLKLSAECVLELKNDITPGRRRRFWLVCGELERSLLPIVMLDEVISAHGDKPQPDCLGPVFKFLTVSY